MWSTLSRKRWKKVMWFLDRKSSETRIASHIFRIHYPTSLCWEKTNLWAGAAHSDVRLDSLNLLIRKYEVVRGGNHWLDLVSLMANCGFSIITGSSSKSGGLKSWEIAVITVGGVLLLVLIACLVIFCGKKRRAYQTI